jgi:hypothetical protein
MGVVTLPALLIGCVAFPVLSFRASEARRGIQPFQEFLDARFRGHDNILLNFPIVTQPMSGAG